MGSQDTDLSDEELDGYVNDVVILVSGFLLAIVGGFLLVEYLVGPVLSRFVPAVSGSILDCVWADGGGDVVCRGSLTARGLLVAGISLPIAVVWINGYQHRLRPILADRGIVPSNNDGE